MLRSSPSLALPFVALLASAAAPVQDLPEKVSEFGRYEGWSEEICDEWVTSSVYVEMRDGVRLAVDYVRPAYDGEPIDGRFPVVWTHSRYHRNPGTPYGRKGSIVDTRSWMQILVKHGYVVAAVGVRGSGASFGRSEGLFSEAETKDAVEIIEWLASQRWSDGNIGMYGPSYPGITQYMAASMHPQALKAIYPDVAAFDFYDLLYPGGVFRRDLIRHWDELTTMLDRRSQPAPVDDDPDGELLQAAVAEHEGNWHVLANYEAAPLRDHATEALDYSKHGPAPFLKDIQAARVPCYHSNGWFDVFALDAVLWFANYKGPQRLTMGAWSHAGVPDPRLMNERIALTEVEQLRWFDRWLKGIENGVDEEPPIQYALMREPGDWTWRTAETWPPPEAEPVEYWFEEGPSESVTSVNDGLLVTERSSFATSDKYQIDLTTTTGNTSRWDNAVGGAETLFYRRLEKNDEKALTYTTRVLEEDLVVVGHPVVTLFVTASAGDADFVVVLEEVDLDGNVRYVTEGVVRGSHRKLGRAPYDNMGLPYQRSFAEDLEPLPKDEPARVMFDLHPTANVFNAGHRLRVSIMGTDADNLVPPAIELPATFSVFRGGAEQASGIVLPVVR